MTATYLFPLGVEYGFYYNTLFSNSWRTGIFLGDLRTLSVSSSYPFSIDFDVLLLIEKHMQLSNHLTFFIFHITPVHRDKGVPKVQLRHPPLC